MRGAAKGGHAQHADFLLIYEYKKLHSLQSLVRTTCRTKTANITKDDVTSASHRKKVTVLQKCHYGMVRSLPN